jgi:PAS domain S-box-containing protein
MTVVVLDRANERLDALIANSPIASVISDPRQRDNPIIACNPAFIELTGYREEEIIGRNCKFLAGPATEPWLTETIRNGVKRHSPVLVEILNYKRDGTPFRNAVLVAPMFDEDGELEFFLGSQVELEPDAPATNANRRMKAAMAVKALTRRQRIGLSKQANRPHARFKRTDRQNAPCIVNGPAGCNDDRRCNTHCRRGRAIKKARRSPNRRACNY